ncbi:hypothetical protein D3C76_906660 [compost metagenome]
MNFSQALQPYIGRTIEVYQSTQVVTGTLISVANGSITVQTSVSYTPGPIITFFTNQIEHVRILPV